MSAPAASSANGSGAKAASASPFAALADMQAAKAAEMAKRAAAATPDRSQSAWKDDVRPTGEMAPLTLPVPSEDVSTLKILPASLAGRFADVDSTKLEPIPPSASKYRVRSSFLHASEAGTWPTAAPVLSRSAFLPEEMAVHLMRNKKDSALAIKFMRGDSITNMEGALHTFLTPIGSVVLSGDYIFRHGHNVAPFAAGQGRRVLMSFAVQPDFEHEEVMMPVVRLDSGAARDGVSLPAGFIPPNKAQKQEAATRTKYEVQLRAHMTYHLTQKHRLPSAQDVLERGAALGLKVHSFDAAMELLQSLALSSGTGSEARLQIPSRIEHHFIRFSGHPGPGVAVLSLEMLFWTYVHQLRNEMSVLQHCSGSEGFVYTIDPPAIFAQSLGKDGQGALLLTRVQTLAFAFLIGGTGGGGNGAAEDVEADLFGASAAAAAPSSTPSASSNPLSRLRVLGFNDYRDSAALGLLQRVFAGTGTSVVSKAALFDFASAETSGSAGQYLGPSGAALVLHNNSDAFGQNIETERMGSMDGVMGCCSDAALVVRRERRDLCECIV